jgi:hypothetical protein
MATHVGCDNINRCASEIVDALLESVDRRGEHSDADRDHR